MREKDKRAVPRDAKNMLRNPQRLFEAGITSHVVSVQVCPRIPKGKPGMGQLPELPCEKEANCLKRGGVEMAISLTLAVFSLEF